MLTYEWPFDDPPNLETLEVSATWMPASGRKLFEAEVRRLESVRKRFPEEGEERWFIRLMRRLGL
jgi:hypothetical protein